LRPPLRTIAGLALMLVAAAQPGAGRSQSPAQSGMSASEVASSEQARHGIDLLMDGDADGAIAVFRQVERSNPKSPLGYLFEADALWWKIYLTTGNLIDPDVFDVSNASSSPYDDEFLRVIHEAIRKSEARLKTGDDRGRSELYAGFGYALLGRFYGLRDNDLPTARAAKKMHALLLQAVQDDPNLIDAYLGLGLYNYFVDTLPTIIKLLKFFIGLPGGSREVGLEQLERVAQHGDMARPEAQFYLAKDYSRKNEEQYAKSLALFQQLGKEFPNNPLWPLLQGSLEIKLGRVDEGEAMYRAALEKTAGSPDPVVQAIHDQARQALARRHPDQKFE
jgi:tetratricopeptide (TPR) repeat protein